MGEMKELHLKPPVSVSLLYVYIFDIENHFKFSSSSSTIMFYDAVSNFVCLIYFYIFNIDFKRSAQLYAVAHHMESMCSTILEYVVQYFGEVEDILVQS